MADEKEMAKKAEEELERLNPSQKSSGLGARLKDVSLGQGGVKVMAEHTVGPDDTLSQIALKYYGSAGRDAWMVIYEANKAVIGENPGILKPGMVLKIPEKA